MKEGIRVTEQDWIRIDLVQQADKGSMTAAQVAGALRRSVRQVRRLISTFRQKGAEGLVHGNRGRVSAKRLAEDVKEQVLQLLRTEYATYNTAQARDDLLRFQGIELSYSALYRLRKGAGLASPRHHDVVAHRKRRERAPQEGLLLQADGSAHAWLEERGPRLNLIVYVDDATSKIAGATFREQEDAVGYLLVLKRICATQGIPSALYTDRHTIFGPQPAKANRQQQYGRQSGSHFLRMLNTLGMQRLAARSPQAKGRVERCFGTLQDRLVKELRRFNACTLDEANKVLADYLPYYNARFAQPAATPQLAYRPWPAAMDPARVFCFHYVRTVAHDNTVAFAGLRLPLPPGSFRRHDARTKAELLMHLDGRLDIYYQQELLATYAHAPDVPVRVNKFVPANPIAYSPTVLTIAKGSGLRPKAAGPAQFVSGNL